ncbi:acyltransferase family protein [Nonomuraea phyllanthi]|uniref:Acyltransferase family protein n=1 Tax=Nonomuraea phyllanthi TaxID=2219224 RepID=A0A5C4WSD4_9ACTN|nr:acyltransferase [Nonomuraea phyllanthi]KAB8195920.1 acyltransferase family protein [Nonomuraea phyllanthi]QFY07375.1 acyltransferase family protein [Nonomuraea phyllanthi]
MSPVPPECPQVVRTAPSRLAWLDALRGIGALAVVGEHLSTWAMPWLRPTSFNLGIYGVLVFFLVSGYIIPTSLERHGDVRAFWIGRIFRLYPLYLTMIGLVLALSWWIPVRQEVPRDGSAVAAHATMLMDAVGSAGVLNTMWTLSYEMIFYLLAAALFVVGVRDRRGLLPVGFAVVCAVVAFVLSGPAWSGGWLSWVSFGAFAAGLTCVIAGYGRTAAACLLGLMALVLVVMSSRVPWFAAGILAVMFAGTAIRRWERGEGPLWPVAVAAALVASTPLWAINAGWWWVRPDVWTLTILLAGATFAGAMAWRARRVPAFLVWLGAISYSLYLVHLPILLVVMRLAGEMRWSPLLLQIGVSAAFLGVLVPASWLSHRFLERPLQRAGRRLALRHPGGPAEVARA